MLEAQQDELNDVGVVLIARQTSSRLPNKVLLEINGKKLVDIVLDAVRINCKNYIFAIPDNNENSELRSYLQSSGYRYFAGSEHDVLGRFIEASGQLSCKYIQRFNCDNLLVDSTYLHHCYRALDNESDIYSNVHCSNHSGSSVEIIRKDKCVITRRPTEYEYEHVFPYFYANKTLSITKLECPKENVFPIDTEMDFNEAVKILT